MRQAQSEPSAMFRSQHQDSSRVSDGHDGDLAQNGSESPDTPSLYKRQGSYGLLHKFSILNVAVILTVILVAILVLLFY
jgi:hypothetical protein